jgi:hypothetical protein
MKVHMIKGLSEENKGAKNRWKISYWHWFVTNITKFKVITKPICN